MERERRNYTTSSAAITFARQGTPIAILSRALLSSPNEIKRILQRAIERGELLTMPPEKAEEVRGAMLTELVHLRDKVEELQISVRDQSEAREAEWVPFVGIYGMTVMQARVIAPLVLRGRQTKAQLYESLCGSRLPQDQPDPKIIDVAICQIRKKLPADVEIATVWGFGYDMNRQHARRVREASDIPTVAAPSISPADLVAAA